METEVTIKSMKSGNIDLLANGAGGIAVGVGVGRDQNAVVALQRRKQSFRHSDG